MTQAPNRWTFFPDPPKRGANLTVCYQFGLTPVVTGTIDGEVNMTPPDGSKNIQVDPDNPCATVFVPDTAVGVTAHDPSGQSEDYSSPTI